jgi:hypothetical protein
MHHEKPAGHQCPAISDRNPPRKVVSFLEERAKRFNPMNDLLQLFPMREPVQQGVPRRKIPFTPGYD